MLALSCESGTEPAVSLGNACTQYVSKVCQVSLLSLHPIQLSTPTRRIPQFIKSKSPSRISQTFRCCIIAKGKWEGHCQGHCEARLLTAYAVSFTLIERELSDLRIPAFTVYSSRVCLEVYVQNSWAAEHWALLYIRAQLSVPRPSMSVLSVPSQQGPPPSSPLFEDKNWAFRPVLQVWRISRPLALTCRMSLSVPFLSPPTPFLYLFGS